MEVPIMSYNHVSKVIRVLRRIEEQAERAWMEDRHDDARTLWRMFGALQYHITGCSGLEEL
jgi:hypothetical protein